MPVITVQMHQATQEQKLELIRTLTAAAVAATQIPAQKFTVLIHELAADNIGVGGKSLTEVKAAR